jgi:hypothetical protein
MTMTKNEILDAILEPVTVGKSTHKPKRDAALEYIAEFLADQSQTVTATLFGVPTYAARFIAKFHEKKMAQAKAKEARRLAGIEKRRGPQKTLVERILQSKNDGTYWKRNREGTELQKQWDDEQGIKRPAGFYKTFR